MINDAVSQPRNDAQASTKYVAKTKRLIVMRKLMEESGRLFLSW